MIWLFLGASCAGKTTIIDNMFVKGQNAKEKKDVVYITETDSAILLGKYCVDKRVRGTDMIPRSDIRKISEQIARLDDSVKDVVLDGERINPPVIDEILLNKRSIKIVLVDCSLETSYRRNLKNGSTATVKRLKTIRSKANNMYWFYEGYCGGIIVDTNPVSDWNDLKYEQLNRCSRTDNIKTYWMKSRSHLADNKNKIKSSNEDYTHNMICVIGNPSCFFIKVNKNRFGLDCKPESVAPKIVHNRYRKAVE